MRLFLAMQVRVMAACMESQADILECTASAQSGRREVTVCFSPMSMDVTDNSQEKGDCAFLLIFFLLKLK